MKPSEELGSPYRLSRYVLSARVLGDKRGEEMRPYDPVL